MKIRSITCFYNPQTSISSQIMAQFSTFIRVARQSFQDAGFEVQTTRLTTTPFPTFLPIQSPGTFFKEVSVLEKQAEEHGFSYLSLGPALPQSVSSYELIPDILQATHNVFLGAVIADAQQGISLPAVHSCGEIILRNAHISTDGFANLRFSALANVSAHSPFFPASYHEGNSPAFALAMECADVAVLAFRNAKSIAEGQCCLLENLETAGRTLTAIARRLSRRFRVHFCGIDFSLAPFPDDWCSIGAAFEQMGISQVGLSGSLAVAAILADTLERGRWLKTGFNGLFLPVLEDSILAERSAQQVLTLKDLLLYSAVCGAGLDTVPLPSDVTSGQLAAVLLDVAALAVRLNKPLTARLMPIPGKHRGELTDFDFAYFANGGIMDVPANPLYGLLTQNETWSLRPRLRATEKKK